MTKLPEDFIRQTQQYIGGEWPELARALTQAPTRAARLQKFAGKTSEPYDSRKTELSSPWYTAEPLAAVPDVIAQQMADPVPWFGSASYISSRSQLGKTAFHELGGIYIQEASATAAVAALNPKPNERVLDLCAAPGSKSTAIGRCLKGQALLYANEIIPARAKILAQNLERSGVPALVTNDDPALLALVWTGQFDAVLVDAPCSGEGMFRKDPQAASEWSLGNVEMCAERQQDILNSAVNLVKPGGRLVYSTCTLNPVENEQVAAWACNNLPLELEPLPDWEGWDNGQPEYAGNTAAMDYTRKLWPHRGRGEGHFVARFRVTENNGESIKSKTEKLSSRSRKTETFLLKGRSLTDWKSWMKTVVSVDPEAFGPPIQHGEGIYVFTETTLPLTEVHVVRNGICTAFVHNHRLAPHHQFAMALKPQSFTRHKNMDEEETLAYLEGQALAGTGGTGWYGLSFSGLPTGWGKAVPGRLNNLYPKGLRRGNLLRLDELTDSVT